MLFIESDFLPGVMVLIREAKESIDVCSYEWMWYPGQRQGTVQGISRELGHAARRGVKVRVLLNNEARHGHLGKVNRKTAHELKVLGCDVLMGGTAKVLHAKFWVFDRAKAVVGSHNLSVRSTKVNAEVSALIESKDDVDKLGCYFDNLWKTWGR